jgi:spermidine/putrescine transport system ATP-binding protein
MERDVPGRVPEPSPTLARVIDRTDDAPEIRLTDLSKHFREVRAVDRVSMDIRTGEFFSMLGPSGCGKTTTLRMIGGFELPTAGRIELRGRDVTMDPPDKRPVNMVFQNYALFPHLDVHENIAFGLRRKGVDRADTSRRVGEALELVHLAGYDKRKPNQLSGGQQQRVALARALVNRPNVLLLDEPLGALDLKLRKALQIELKRVQTEVGITFVYVTHDQEEALTMSDRIAVMNRGRVEQLGTPEELYERPRTRFVADFIGTSNLLSGSVESIDAGLALVRLTSGETCRATAGSGVGVGRSVELSVRPEAVAIQHQNGTGPSTAPGTLSATIEQVAYLGGNVQYLVRSTGGLSITVVAPKTGGRLPVGDAVDVTWSPGDALVLAEPPSAQEETAR